MVRLLSDTLADTTLPAAALAEMERLNEEAAPLHIWLRTRANQPLQRAWHEAAEEPVPDAPLPGEGAPRQRPLRVLPHVWKWTEIEPYLHRIAAIAPLEFTERQQFLLTNPGLMGALRVTNTIRIAVSIYKPGDQAPQHLHTPSASRTILSETGGYTLIEGEQCVASRGDLILTPAGTWHGHGNDDREPVIWMDVLDWPLLEYLDVIWMRHDFPSSGGDATTRGELLADALQHGRYRATLSPRDARQRPGGHAHVSLPRHRCAPHARQLAWTSRQPVGRHPRGVCQSHER